MVLSWKERTSALWIQGGVTEMVDVKAEITR